MVSDRTVSLGGGVRVPYPEPTTEAASKVGRRNLRTGTRAETALRSELHKRGLRFRKDLRLDLPGIRVRPDVVFTRARLSVFIDGCFWHCCPEHMHMPKSNLDYWEPKLAANRARDVRVSEALVEAGWTVMRIWEHEAVGDAADRIEAAVRSASD